MKTFMVMRIYENPWLLYLPCYAGLSNTRELPNAFACRRLVEGVMPVSWKQILEGMYIERLFDLLDNHLNIRTRELV